ncbi:MAG: hypothetical protein WCC40_13030, partial [Rhodomicrobium sp.]
MIRRLIFAAGALTVAFAPLGSLRAQEPQVREQSVASPLSAATPAESASVAPAAKAVTEAPASPEAEALHKALSGLAAGDTDEERNERAALESFYEARNYAPLWLTPAGGSTPKAAALMAEIQQADQWGLEPHDFPLPARLTAQAAPASPEKAAADEIQISMAVLKYGRYARGGRIMNPSEQLSSYLDRRPQLLNPKSVLDGIAAADQPDAYLRGLH